MTETNVFEWCLEHSNAEDGNRRLLLWLAFRDEYDDHQPILPSIVTMADALDMPWQQVTLSLHRLLDTGEIAVTPSADGLVTIYRFPTYEMWRRPHTIALNTWNGEPYEGEDAHRWDFIEIECPHQPATETMPCAKWLPCGCPEGHAATPFWEGGDGDGSGPCARSATGTHRYVDGEPHRPVASCFAVGWEISVADAAFELGLMPGTHLVRPWWDGDAVQLELVEPQVVRHG